MPDFAGKDAVSVSSFVVGEKEEYGYHWELKRASSKPKVGEGQDF